MPLSLAETMDTSAGFARPASPLPYEWAGDVQPVLDGLWLIDGWLPKSGVGVLYGHPGCGKTFLALDMSRCVAMAVSWAGRAVEAGLVIYVAAEGQAGFRNRLAAVVAEGRLSRDAPFAFVPCPIDLQAPDGDIERLVTTIRQMAGKRKELPALIVIDTLSKTFGAGKENTDDMTAYLTNCQRVASEFDCFTLILHHRPKDQESKDLRGHSSLRGGIETAILVEGGETRFAITTKQKDAEDNQRVGFQLERVVLGHDRKDHEVSTCLVNIVEDEMPSPVSRSPIEQAKHRLRGHNRSGLRAIEDVVATLGQTPPMDIPSDVIDREKVWKVCRSEQISERLTSEFLGLVKGDADKLEDNAARTTRRVLQALKAAKILGSWREWLWLNS